MSGDGTFSLRLSISNSSIRCVHSKMHSSSRSAIQTAPHFYKHRFLHCGSYLNPILAELVVQYMHLFPTSISKTKKYKPNRPAPVLPQFIIYHIKGTFTVAFKNLEAVVTEATCMRLSKPGTSLIPSIVYPIKLVSIFSSAHFSFCYHHL